VWIALTIAALNCLEIKGGDVSIVHMTLPYEERIWIIFDLESLWIEECRSFFKCTPSQIA